MNRLAPRAEYMVRSMGDSATGPVDHDYDRIWSEVYGDLQQLGPAHRHMRRILADLLATIDYRSAIEVGCGDGANLPLITSGRSLHSLAGVDIAPEPLERVREHWDGEFSLGDIQAEAPAGSWDLVFSSLVLEHLPDDEAALRNMRSMCSRWLMISTIAGDFERYRPWEEQVGHVRNYRRGELEAKLRRAGFEPVRAVYWGFPFYSPIARRLQNSMRAENEYGPRDRLLARIMYAVYFLNTRRRGDLLFMVARV